MSAMLMEGCADRRRWSYAAVAIAGFWAGGCSCGGNGGPLLDGDAGEAGTSAGGTGGDGSGGIDGKGGSGGASASGGASGEGGVTAGGAGAQGGSEGGCDCGDLSCNGEGETQRALCTESGVCICETQDGYFVGLEGNSAARCDADEDGFVNDNAQAALDGDDEVLKENARCDLRRATSVVLADELGASHTIDLGEDFPRGLPLYESARNDGAPAASTPVPYGGEAISFRALNSFTKACVSRVEDYNDNGIGDVSEWAGRALGHTVTRNAQLESYYGAYLRFSYFLELHDGWFEGGAFYIRERLRADDTVAGVPLRYPEGVSPYWQTCERHRDIDYEVPQSRVGGDFTDPTYGWTGMTHHSQFKCVEILSQGAYYAGNYTRTENPELVFLPEGEPGVARLAGAGAVTIRNGCPRNPTEEVGVEIYDWVPNHCRVTGSHTGHGVTVPNPVSPNIECEVVDYEDVDPGVRFMAVGYENHACDRSDDVTVGIEDYSRGCINECAEHTVEACPNYDEDTPAGSGRFTCDDESRAFFGQLQCGCGRSYGGPNCEIGCPGDGALMSTDFSIETRHGRWLCGRAVASAGEMSVGEYSLRGVIPIAPVDGTVLESADGLYRLETR